MPRTTLFLAVLVFSAAMSGASAPQDAGAPPAAADGPRLEQQEVDPATLPWPMVLGMRVVALERQWPVVETVVLVPDEATFLAEIGRWTPTAHWPVLFEDDRLAPLFIERFAPKRVFRRASVGSLPADPAVCREAALKAIIRAFGGDPARQTLMQAYQSRGWTPPGVVLTDFADPAWPAAVALAAGRGQMLDVVEGNFGGASSTLEPDALARLQAAVGAALDRTGLPYGGNRDAIEAISLVRTLPAKAKGSLPAGRRVDIPVQGLDPNADLATTDLLGRGADGTRFAVVGQIFGSRGRATYAAMCSLFLPRERLSFFNTYDSAGDRGVYAVGSLEPILPTLGWRATFLEGNAAGLVSWWRIEEGDDPPDVLFANSSGLATQMSLGDGSTGFVADLPVLRRPLALHLIHSFSLERPDDLATLGGALLDAGVYAYVGAVSEPFLASFIPPASLLERLVNRVPFLAAARSYEGPFAPPWRVMTYGDPLMLIMGPTTHALPRIPPPATELVAGEDLREAVKNSIRAARTDPAAAARALVELRMLGEEEIALKLWASLRSTAELRSAATGVLPIYFDRGDVGGFVEAYRLLRAPSEQDRAMLWRLAMPSLIDRPNGDLARFMTTQLRTPRRWIDLERVLPVVSQSLGPGFARRLAQRELDEAVDAEDLRQMQRIVASLGGAGLEGGVDAEVGRDATIPSGPLRGNAGGGPVQDSRLNP